MLLTTVIVNLLGEEVRFGPYCFEDSKSRNRWERQLRQEFKQLNTSLGLKPRSLQPILSSQGDQDDALFAPSPEEIVRNLCRLTEN
jgi:hypothetical protein